MTTELIIQLSSVIVSTVSIIVTLIISIKSINVSNKQAQQQRENSLFAEYTKRYQEIILAMPDDVFDGTAADNVKTRKYLNLYFDLCSEEFHLYKQGFIPDKVWNNWKEGMVLTTNNDLYRQCWKELNFNYNDDFKDFFETSIIKANK